MEGRLKSKLGIVADGEVSQLLVNVNLTGCSMIMTLYIKSSNLFLKII